MWANTLCPFSICTRNIAFGSGSVTVPSTSIASFFGKLRVTLADGHARPTRGRAGTPPPRGGAGPPPGGGGARQYTGARLARHPRSAREPGVLDDHGLIAALPRGLVAVAHLREHAIDRRQAPPEPFLDPPAAVDQL